jgi:hypothetical protein
MADRSMRKSPVFAALTASGRKVLTVIERQVWRGGGAISLALLMERADLCRSSVRHGVRLLVELGFIEVALGPRRVSVFSLSARWRSVDAASAVRLAKRARSPSPPRPPSEPPKPVEPTSPREEPSTNARRKQLGVRPVKVEVEPPTPPRQPSMPVLAWLQRSSSPRRGQDQAG